MWEVSWGKKQGHCEDFCTLHAEPEGVKRVKLTQGGFSGGTFSENISVPLAGKTAGCLSVCPSMQNILHATYFLGGLPWKMKLPRSLTLTVLLLAAPSGKIPKSCMDLQWNLVSLFMLLWWWTLSILVTSWPFLSHHPQVKISTLCTGHHKL